MNKTIAWFLLLSLPVLLNCQNFDHLSSVDKIYGLSKFWAEVKANYVNYDALSFDWDAKYLEYLEKVENTTSNYDFYALLQEMCASLKDSHTTITLPNEMRLTHRRNFPLRTELIEDRVIIKEVYNDSLLSIGIKRGDEIVMINGKDVHKYAEKNIKPYISSSTEQDLKFRTYTYELFTGHKDSLLRLTIRNQGSTEQVYKLSRMLKWNLFKRKPNLEFTVTEDNIGILTLNSFSGNDIIPKFDSIYTLIQKTNGLIIDNRSNGGGSSTPGYHIISHLVDEPFYGTFWVSRQHIPKFIAGTWGTSYYFQRRKMYQPAEPEKYTNPVVLLIGPATFSAAEDFSVVFKNLSLGKVIGQSSGGSSGEPMRFSLPGGGRFKVCTERNSFPDGREFVGIGVQPDIMIAEEVISFRANRDRTMLKALEVVSKIN